MEELLQTKESLKVRRSKRSPGVENTNDQVLIGFIWAIFLTRKKELRFAFLGGKIHVHVGYLFLVFAFPHRDPTEGRELTGSRMKTSVRLTRDSKSQSHICGREKMGCVLVYRYTREGNFNELRHNSMYGYENKRNSLVYRYTRTAPKNGNVSAETWEKPHRIVNATLSYSTNISKEKCFSNPRENVCYSISQRASTKPLSHEAIFFFG